MTRPLLAATALALTATTPAAAQQFEGVVTMTVQGARAGEYLTRNVNEYPMAALLIAGMMAMFLVAICLALGKGLEMSCGCFASQGAAEDPISWRTIVRDSGWLLLALYVLLLDRRPLGLDRLWLKEKP